MAANAQTCLSYLGYFGEKVSLRIEFEQEF